jgi:hypothetical protein
MSNRLKSPIDWASDIEMSVSHYNVWYRRRAPEFWEAARERAALAATVLFSSTDYLLDLSPEDLEPPGDMLSFLRNSTAPPLAKERAASLAGVRKGVVDRLHKGEGLSARYDPDEIARLLGLIIEMIDPVVFPWVVEGRRPSDSEASEAALIVGDRSARTFFDPVLRNKQESRQVAALSEYLTGLGYSRSSAGRGLDLPPETYSIHRNVPYRDESGMRVNLPIDCVVNPGDGRPIALIELKSAGDFTNVNKRRKEEAAKAAGVRREHGDKAVFLLQLFGYFNPGYLSYESAAEIDWAWDHRLDDFDEYVA